MKLFTINLLILFFAFMVVFVPKTAFANAPNVFGSVQTEDGTGISGVWVRWTDEREAFRLTQTDGEGKFFFPSWQAIDRGPYCNTSVDFNLDGVNDTKKANDCMGYHFGCAENPHNFEVIQPANDRGTYSKISGITLNNGAGDKNVGVITYTPPFGSIMGSKVQMPGNTKTSLISGQEIVLDDRETKTDNPFTFSALPGTHTMKANRPVDYHVGYTLCPTATNCHNDTPVMENTVTFTMPTTGSVNIWWHYFPPNATLPPSATVSAYIKTTGGNVHSNQ